MKQSARTNRNRIPEKKEFYTVFVFSKKKKNIERLYTFLKHKMSKPNKEIWSESAWIGLFTDPYISGIGELERGHFSSSMSVRIPPKKLAADPEKKIRKTKCHKIMTSWNSNHLHQSSNATLSYQSSESLNSTRRTCRLSDIYWNKWETTRRGDGRIKN